MGLRVIIPVAGVGSRLRPHTHTAPKVMLQVAGKPMIGHILDELKRYNVEEITLVVGHMDEKIRDYVTSAYDFRFRFVPQRQMRGLGHAIWLTGEAYRDTPGPVLIILGDTIFEADFASIIASDVNWIGVKEVEAPQRFGVVQLHEGNIRAMLEKPEQPPTNLAIVGIYYLADAQPLYACLDQVIQSGRTSQGEFQLTDALQLMIERGAHMKPFFVDGWYDCGKPETLLATNRTLLLKQAPSVSAHQQSRLDGSLIRPPVSIGRDVDIQNAILGPYVTVADGVRIHHSLIRDSIISREAEVENILLQDSIIADRAKVSGLFHSLSIGDSSEMHLGRADWSR